VSTFPDIVVDPYLVCLPRECDDVTRLDQFVDNLLSWSDLLQREDVNVHFPRSCLEALVEEGQYPYGQELKKMAARLGASHLSDDFVCRVAQAVLERTPTLEDRCSINVVIFDEDTCKVEPEVYVNRLAAKIGWGFKHGLTVIACFGHSRPDEGFLIASATSTPEAAFEGEEIKILARIEAVDCTDDTRNWTDLVPVDVNQALPVTFSRESLFEHLGCLRLWGEADSPENARDAINTRVGQLFASGATNRRAAREFRFGDGFLQSARGHGFGARSDLATNLIDSCARILVDLPKQAVKPFRVSENSGEQLVRADGAAAFRTHLTKAGAGFRLMYWAMADGTIEFANVGTKFELEIL
jgi:hypothetical protein